MKRLFKPFRNVLFLLKPYWKYGKIYFLITLLISVIVAPLNSIASVLFTQTVIDAVNSGASFGMVIAIILRFLLVLLITLLIQNAYDVLYSERKVVEIQQKINSDIYDRVLKTDYKYFDDPEFYNNYTWAIKEYANKSKEAASLVVNIFRSIATIISMVSIILVLGPWLIVITIIEMLITICFETRRNRINISKREEILPLDRKLGYVHRVFYQREYASDVKATNLRRHLFDLYNINGSEKIRIIKKYANPLLAWLYAQNFLGVLYNASIMSYISYGLIVSKRIVGVGKFMSLITANNQLMNSLYGFFNLIAQANNLDLYATKIRMFFEIESKIEESIAMRSVETLPFNIDIQNMSFQYPNSVFGLHNINLSIKAGEKIAIVGENGAGKTTLAKLLLRFYDPVEGEIYINNISLKEYNLQDLRNKVGTAFQSTNVYAFSLAQNLKLYMDVDDEQIKSTMDSLGLDSLFTKTPGNINTELTKEFDKDGIVLSNGEIQKIGIARIMNHRFGVLILDEPSSALDPIAEYELTNALYNQSNKTTTILIAHRLSMVRDADRIYVMKEGRIFEEGTHDELMQLKSLYYDMFTKQSENYSDSFADGKQKLY